MFKELTIALSAGAISAGIMIYYFTNKNNSDQLWFKSLLDKQYRLIESFYNEQKNKFKKDTYNNVEEQILNITSELPSHIQIQATSDQSLNSDYTNVEHSDADGLPKRSSSMASFFDSIKLSQLKK